MVASTPHSRSWRPGGDPAVWAQGARWGDQHVAGMAGPAMGPGSLPLVGSGPKLKTNFKIKVTLKTSPAFLALNTQAGGDTGTCAALEGPCPGQGAACALSGLSGQRGSSGRVITACGQLPPPQKTSKLSGSGLKFSPEALRGELGQASSHPETAWCPGQVLMRGCGFQSGT